MSWLLEPLRFEFVRQGIVVAAVAGAMCGAVGCYVVLRNLSSIGHGLSHAIFGGAAASAVLSVNFYVGAGVWGLLSAWAIGKVTQRRIVGADAAIGVITTASFALGLALVNRFGTASRSIEAVLFGSILGVSWADVIAVCLAAMLVLAVVYTHYRKLLFATFDPEVAAVSGVRISVVDSLLMISLAATLLVSMKVLGVLLVSALLVTPAVIARMLTNSFGRMLAIAPSLGAVLGATGMYLSYHLDISSGATIILCAAAVFLVVYGVTGRSGRRRAASVARGH